VSLIDMNELRALVAEEVRRALVVQNVGGGRSSNAAQEPAELWTADDVARYLKSSRSWVYQQAEAGRLPYLKVIGLLRFEPAAVRAFVQGWSADGPVGGAKVVPLRGKVG
jgi:excisionase family DNA binding protein